MSLRYRGACPSCAAAVPLRAPLAPGGTCAACGRRFLILVPEPDEPLTGDEGEVAVRLLALGGERGSPPLPRPLWQLGRLALLAGAGLALAFVVAMVLVLVGSDEPGWFFRWAFEAVLNLILVPALGTGALWVLLGAKDRASPAFDAARSALVLTAGFAATLAVNGLFGLAWRGVHEHVSVQAFALAQLALGGLSAGWLTARLAPLAPFKHGLALGIAMALSGACWAMLAGSVAMAMAAALVAGVCLPWILAGAWLHLRFRRRPVAPPGTPPAASTT